MPVDASIPLGYQQPDPMKTISGLLNIRTQVQSQQLQRQELANQQLANEQGQVSLQGSQIELGERQNVQKLLANIKPFQDEQGNLDFNKLFPEVMKVAPTTGSGVLQHLYDAQQSATAAKSAVTSVDAATRKMVGGALYSLKGQPPEMVAKTLDDIDRSYPTLKGATDFFRKNLVGPAMQNPNKMAAALDSAGRMMLETPQQKPEVGFVSTNQGTQPYNVNAQSPGGAGPTGTPMAPPNVVLPTTGGGSAIGNTASGKVTDFTPVSVGSAAPTVNFPIGETADTQRELQAQRSSAQAATTQAGTMHDINRTIMREADAGLNTGRLGEFTQKLASLTGYNVAPGTSTDYNLLGKMLERSALTASQGMGPHTNAGLEAQVRANGSLEYTPDAIKKIASLNDALVSGQQAYQKGLETVISKSPNGVFAKRQFDQSWGANFDPQAFALLNAKQNGDKKEYESIIQNLGGPKSKQFNNVLIKLDALRRLTNQGAL